MVRQRVFRSGDMSYTTSLRAEEAAIKEHMDCHGKLFPPRPGRQSGRERRGVVLGYVFPQPGTVTLPPEITADLEEWDRSTECREFSICWQLSAAKALLDISVRN